VAKPAFPKSLKIAVIAPKFPISGQSTIYGFIWPILRSLSQAGHKIHVFSWKSSLSEPSITIDGVQIQFLSDLHKAKNILEFPRLVSDAIEKEHTKEPFHLVHSLSRDGLYLAERRRKLKFATAFDVQATSMGQLFSFIGMSEDTPLSKIKNGLQISYTFMKNYLKKDRILLNASDGIFVTSPQQKLILERYYLYPQTRIFTIPYGIDLQDLSVRQKSEILRKKLNIPINCKVAVTLTDMLEKNEMLHILRAFQKVAVKKPNSRLIVVGSGPHFKTIEFEMLNLALASKVMFVGAVPPFEVSDYIDLADVYINLSSRSDSFESTTFEAMAQQKIVIGSEVSPLANIIEPMRDGFLIRPADTSSLCELMIDIFSHPENYAQVGEQAREKVLSLFDLKKLVSQTINAYQQILKLTHWYGKPMSLDQEMRP